MADSDQVVSTARGSASSPRSSARSTRLEAMSPGGPQARSASAGTNRSVTRPEPIVDANKGALRRLITIQFVHDLIGKSAKHRPK